MRIETLRERIENAKVKIEKKQNTIIKKEATIVKKQNLIAKTTDEQDRRWLGFDIKHLKEDIERLTKEITETQKSLEKYEAQMVGEMENEQKLTEIPESLKRMQTELVERWDEYDLRYKERVKEDHRTMSYEDFRKKYRGIDTYTIMYRTTEQIHNSNMQDAKVLILNLIKRVRSITGEITDWAGVRAEVGTWGMTVLNGFVIGKEGRAEVESIFAGGYNIQRLHVRVLVHER